MKRIEDKIQEIERRDKTNRRLYIGVVLLIALFMLSTLYFGNEIAKREDTISAQIVEQSETYKKLDASFNSLRKSLRPNDYWNHIKKENSVEGYISYITNDWGIDKTAYLSKAIENLESQKAIGFQGWLFVGNIKADGIYQTRDVVEVIRPVNGRDNFKDSKIEVGDIVQLTTTSNRNIYKSETSKTPKSQGWRNKTKGFVTAIWKDPKTTDFKIQIKYY